MLKEGALIEFKDQNSIEAHNVIFLDGVYVDTATDKGCKGFMISHESDYF